MILGLVVALTMWADGCFLAEGVVSPFERRWYCKQGDAAGLRPLDGERVYRFVLIPTFHPTRAATVRFESGVVVAEGIVLTGHGGYEPGSIARTTRQAVSLDDWRLLEERLENAGVWEPPDGEIRMGEDGAQWLLEGRRSGEVFFRDVWSPTESTHPQYRAAAVLMLQLAGIKPDGELY